MVKSQQIVAGFFDALAMEYAVELLDWLSAFQQGIFVFPPGANSMICYGNSVPALLA